MPESRANPNGNSDRLLYNLYLLYAIPDSNGDYLWEIAFRMVETVPCTEEGEGPVVTSFPSVLGREGFRVDLTGAPGDRDSSISPAGDFVLSLLIIVVRFFQIYQEILRTRFSHSHDERRVSSRSRSAFQPSTSLASVVSAHTAGTSPARRSTIL